MQMVSAITAQEALDAILKRTEAEREAVQTAVLAGALSPTERDQLRTRLLEITAQDYPPALEQGDEAFGWTRTWLFSLLAIVSDDDDAARECLLKHLDPEIETNSWVSYWLLYGLIKGKSHLLSEAAARTRNHPNALVSMLSLAVTAQSPHAAEDRRQLEAALCGQDWDQKWAVMRALRWVILQDTYSALLQGLCDEVDYASGMIDDFDRRAYDAIIALGNITPQTDAARRAADALDRFVFRARRHPQRVPERCKAIQALGKLRIEKVDLLLDELRLDDPTMAREAALALEMMLGTRRAVGRVFEKAHEVLVEQRATYADALRWMVDRQAVIAALDDLGASGQAGAEDTARDLMHRVGGTLAFERLRVQRKAMNNFTQLLGDTQKAVDQQFNQTIEASRFGFRIQTWMDRLVFAAGMLFIVASGGKALFNNTESDWAGIALVGGVGILGVLYSTLIARPRENIKQAVLDQSQLQMIFLGYVRQLNHVDQAYIEQILQEEPLSADEVQQFVSITHTFMAQAVEALNSLREKL